MTDDEITGEPLGLMTKKKLIAMGFFLAGGVFGIVTTYQVSVTGTVNELAAGLAVVCFICSIIFSRFEGF